MAVSVVRPAEIPVMPVANQQCTVKLSCIDKATGTDTYSVDGYAAMSTGNAQVDGSANNTYFCGISLG